MLRFDRICFGLALGLACTWALSQSAGKGRIFTCKDAKGNVLMTQVEAECAGTGTQVHKANGGVENLPPTLTLTEQRAAAAAQAEEEKRLAAQRELEREDVKLKKDFPDEAAHRRAREAKLNVARQSVQSSDRRIAVLASERKPLEDEARFYDGKPLPAALKSKLEANSTAVAAQMQMRRTKESELADINARSDLELERLRKLWAGTPSGSMGPIRYPAPVAGK